MLIINNKALKVGNKWLNPSGSPPPPTYYYVTTSGTNGTVLATPASGITGTEVTLSNNPDTGYEFDSYTITGATLKNTNQFDIGNSDVSVVGNFVASSPTFDEVTIGTQTWMAKNLAIDDGSSGIFHYDNVTANGVNFGTQYYYNWDAANRIAESIDGWHLPTEAEFNTLLSYVGSDSGIKLKSSSGWNNNGNGTDDYGFNALPVGMIYVADQTTPPELIDTGESINLRSSTPFGGISIILLMSYEYSDARINQTYKSYGFSVRLIKDT